MSNHCANPSNNTLKNEKSIQVNLGVTHSLTPDLSAFLDVINAYGRNNIDRLEFNERLGTNQDTGLEVFPQIGLRLEF